MSAEHVFQMIGVNFFDDEEKEEFWISRSKKL